jgi:CRP-like cAMP-binding protein
MASFYDIELLKGLKSEVVDSFSRLLDTRKFAADAVIYAEGSPAEHVYLMISGRVKLVRCRSGRIESILGVPGPGDLLGDLSIFEYSSQPMTAMTKKSCEIALLPAGDMREWLETYPEAMNRYIRVLHSRLHVAIDSHHDMFGLDVASRVASALLNEASRFGLRTEQGLLVTWGLTHEELALHVRATREHVNKVVARFSRQGWIRKIGADLVILDESSLMQCAGRTDRR